MKIDLVLDVKRREYRGYTINRVTVKTFVVGYRQLEILEDIKGHICKAIWIALEPFDKIDPALIGELKKIAPVFVISPTERLASLPMGLTLWIPWDEGRE